MRFFPSSILICKPQHARLQAHLVNFSGIASEPVERQPKHRHQWRPLPCGFVFVYFASDGQQWFDFAEKLLADDHHALVERGRRVQNSAPGSNFAIHQIRAQLFRIDSYAQACSSGYL